MSTIIESIIKRPHGTVVNFGDVTYHFKPNEHGAHVAELIEPAHVDRLLAISEGYRLYRAPAQATTQAQASAPEPEPEPESVPAQSAIPVEPEAPDDADGDTKPESAEQENAEGEQPQDAEAQEALEKAADAYIQLFGKKPHARWSVETINAKIAEKIAEG